ncbi:entericidin, EcnA/B family [Ostreiculturibacter nitratireducens]
MTRKLILIAMLAGLAACNTVAGVGEDISGAARTVRDTF